jgi:hypothetical protein
MLVVAEGARGDIRFRGDCPTPIAVLRHLYVVAALHGIALHGIGLVVNR